MIHLLENILGPSIKHKDEYMFFCAFCSHHKPKLSIKIDMGLWKCWICNSKGRSLFSLFKQLNCTQEQIRELKIALGEIDFNVLKKEIINVNLSLPSEFIPLWEPSKLFEYRNAKSYLINRGLTEQDIIRYYLGFCPAGLYAERIIIPSYADDGKLNYFVARSYYESSFKYKNPPISKNVVGFESQIWFDLPVVLCEGVFDAMTIKTNAIPLFGKIPSKKLLQKLSFQSKTIYLALDKDALRDTSKLAQELIAMGKSVFLVSLNEKDPNEIGFEKMKILIQNSKQLDFYSALKLQF